MEPPSRPTNPRTVDPGRKLRADELRHPILLFEFRQLCIRGAQAGSAGLRLLRLASDGDVVLQALGAHVDADFGLFILAELNRTQRGEVLRVLRNLDQFFGLRALGQLYLALFPGARNVLLPRFLHAADETVRTAQQQHVRTQCVAAREDREILQNDGIEQRSHQLIGRNALLLQPVDVGLGKDAALAGHGMQLDAGIALVAELVGGNLQLGIDLVDDRARAAGALVVHRRNLLLASGVLVFFEDDDLGVLAAKFDHRVHFRMHLLDCERDRRYFLHKLCAHQVGQRAAARAGDEDAAIVRSDADLVLHALEEFQQLLRLLGLVALVVLPDHLVGFGFNDYGLHRGRADVHADRVHSLVAGLRGDLARLGEDARGKGSLLWAQNSLGIQDGHRPSLGRAHRIRVGESDSLSLRDVAGRSARSWVRRD